MKSARRFPYMQYIIPSSFFACFLPAFLPKLAAFRSSFSNFFWALRTSLEDGISELVFERRGTNSAASGFSFEDFYLLDRAKMTDYWKNFTPIHRFVTKCAITSTLWTIVRVASHISNLLAPRPAFLASKIWEEQDSCYSKLAFGMCRIYRIVLYRAASVCRTYLSFVTTLILLSTFGLLLLIVLLRFLMFSCLHGSGQLDLTASGSEIIYDARIALLRASRS
jgi:hypothetical protein